MQDYKVDFPDGLSSLFSEALAQPQLKYHYLPSKRIQRMPNIIIEHKQYRYHLKISVRDLAHLSVNTKRIGTVMIFFACILGMVVLTLFFSESEKEKSNQSQSAKPRITR